uniref:RNase H type-1 domain-containing protein n=1 Tax=Cajanus cajan TaxID=3821 RepID=A0A151TFM2_CAJCA|nr:hypothetical protein KK1_012109 [Cajanus cajan]
MNNPRIFDFGGVIRNTNWVAGFAGFCGYTTMMNVELHVIYQGFQLAWNRGIHNLICESDSKSTLLLITQDLISSYLYVSYN